MAVSKVILNGTTEIDLTGDTAIADDVMQSKTFHLASGLQATGTATGGGGSPYDFVIKCTNTTGWSSTASDYTWEVGSFDDVADKFMDGDLINGIAYIRTASYDDEDDIWSYRFEIMTIHEADAYGGQDWYDEFGLTLQYVDDQSDSRGVSTTYKRLTIHRNSDPQMTPTYFYSTGHASGRLN